MPPRKRTNREVTLAKRVRERLRERYLAPGGKRISQRQLAKRIGLSPQTVNGWFSNPPAMPDVISLVQLADRENLSLNHLFLDDGPPLRGQVTRPADLETELRAHVKAELRSELDPGELQDVFRVVGSPLEWILKHYRDEHERIRRLRAGLQEALKAADDRKWAYRGRLADATRRWVEKKE